LINKFLFLKVIFLLFVIDGFTQTNLEIFDTISYKGKTIVLYRNHTWGFKNSEKIFDENDSIYSNYWIVNELFPYSTCSKDFKNIEINLIKDSIGKFVMPVPGRLFGDFKSRHFGWDLDLKTGDPVKAAFAGKVRYACYNKGGFGNLVIIRHYNGLETYYAHLFAIHVSVNQYVEAGDIIGLGGSTGRAYGPHLHFEIRYMDKPLNPNRIIDFKTGTLLSNMFILNSSSVLADKDTSNIIIKKGNSKFYNIKKGDTLSLIARRNNTTVKKLCILNNIKENSKLTIGKRIKVK